MDHLYKIGLLLLILNSNSTKILAQFFPSQPAPMRNGGQQPLWPDYDYVQQFQPPPQFTGSQPQQVFPQQQRHTVHQNFNPYARWPAQQPPPVRLPYARHVAQQKHHQLPYAGYRESAVDQAQRERLARIAAESENFGAGQAPEGIFGQPKYSTPNTGEGIQRILATVAEKLPKIAESMAKLSGSPKDERTSASNNADAKNGFEIPPQPSGDGEGQLRLPRREYGANQLEKDPSENREAAVINSMPEPSSIFSINKLLSAFGAGDNKVVPVLKSVDLESSDRAAQKRSELLYAFTTTERSHLTPPAEAPPTPDPLAPPTPGSNPFDSLLEKFGLPNLMPGGNQDKSVLGEQQQLQQKEDDNGDLFGSLMKGKLPQMPDWLRSLGLEQMLATAGANDTTKSGAETAPMDHGNALAQLFGGAKKGAGDGAGGSKGFALSSVFGSGLDDAPRGNR